jgi:hypothetical protein
MAAGHQGGVVQVGIALHGGLRAPVKTGEML